MSRPDDLKPKILDVGQCDYDHGRISAFLSVRLGAQVDRAHGLDDARALMEETHYDLVLINRLLDLDQKPGLEVIKSLKEDADPSVSRPPLMLVSNFPDAQEAAVEAGAVPGFGKAELGKPEIADRIGVLLRRV